MPTVRLFSLLAAAFAVAAETFPYYCAECSTDERSYDEQPELLEGLSACEECRADASCRVH